MKRTPLKRKTSQLSKGKGLKRTGKKLQAKKPTEEQKEIARMTRDADKRFCEQLWVSRGGRSEVSRAPLGDPNWACVHHLLPKSKFPVYRYEDWNVILLTIEEHANVENGNGYPEVTKRTDAAKQRHEQGQ